MCIFITNFSVLICHIDISLAPEKWPGLMECSDKFSYPKNPRIENFKPKELLWSSRSLEIPWSGVTDETSMLLVQVIQKEKFKQQCKIKTETRSPDYIQKYSIKSPD